MKLVDSISRSANYGITNIDHAVKRIAGNPGIVKKVFQVATKAFEAVDLCYSTNIHSSEINHLFKGTVDIIGFYGTYKNLFYWVNLFSKENIDREALEKSINSSLCASHKKETKQHNRQQKLAKKIFEDVMTQDTYHSKSEVLNHIEQSLRKNGYDEEQAKIIANRVVVEQKKRPTTELLYSACFTITDLGSNILNLQKWHILDLSKLAATIGGQSPVFMFAMNLGAGVVFGTVASAGLFLMFGESSHKAVVQAMKYHSATTSDEKEKAYRELCGTLIGLCSTTADLVATAAPLLFALNPPVVVALAIVAKGTGIVCFLVK